jgi:hypothetical protein
MDSENRRAETDVRVTVETAPSPVPCSRAQRLGIDGGLSAYNWFILNSTEKNVGGVRVVSRFSRWRLSIGWKAVVRGLQVQTDLATRG